MTVFIGKVVTFCKYGEFLTIIVFPRNGNTGIGYSWSNCSQALLDNSYFELIVLHVDDMCSVNHVYIKHIIADDEDNFNRY